MRRLPRDQIVNITKDVCKKSPPPPGANFRKQTNKTNENKHEARTVDKKEITKEYFNQLLKEELEQIKITVWCRKCEIKN